MENKYDVMVTKKRFLKPKIKLMGKIIKENVFISEDWTSTESEEKKVTILLENGKKIKIKKIDDEYNYFHRYSYEKIS